MGSIIKPAATGLGAAIGGPVGAAAGGFAGGLLSGDGFGDSLKGAGMSYATGGLGGAGSTASTAAASSPSFLSEMATGMGFTDDTLGNILKGSNMLAGAIPSPMTMAPVEFMPHNQIPSLIEVLKSRSKNGFKL